MRTPLSLAFVSTLLPLANPLAAQAAWTRVYPTTNPAGRVGAAMAFDELRGVAVLLGGVADAWQWNGTNWSTMPAGPAARYNTVMAFDAARGQIVVFGGASLVSGTLGDTWTWNGSSWSQRTPAHAPTLRDSAAMAFDPTRSVTVLFGGGNPVLGDLWEWNGTDWLQRSFAGGPSPRSFAAMAFDPSTSKLLLFGGHLANDAVSDETWLWDGTAWQQRFPANTPYIRFSHSMVADTARRRVALIGTYFGNDPFAWEWDGSTWSPRLIASPSPRYGAAMAYDSVRHEVVLFGGSPSISSTVFADTWVYATPLPASFTPYGAGCPGGNGTPVLAPAQFSLPWLGDQFRTQVGSLPQTAAGAFFLLGLGQTPPVSLAPFGLPGCDTWVTLDESVFLPVVAGTATRTLSVPNSTALAGLHVFEQAAVVDSAANGGAALSNAGEIVLGIR